SVGVLKKDTYSLVVMLATITALSTPYAVRGSKGLATWLDAKLPERWREGLNRYSSAVQRGGGISEWRVLLQRQILNVMVNSALVGAVCLFFQVFAKSWLIEKFGSSRETQIGSFILALLIAAPFFL